MIRILFYVFFDCVIVFDTLESTLIKYRPFDPAFLIKLQLQSDNP